MILFLFFTFFWDPTYSEEVWTWKWKYVLKTTTLRFVKNCTRTTVLFVIVASRTIVVYTLLLSNQFWNEMSQRPKINSTFVKFQQWPVFLWSANHCSLWILISGAFDVLSGPFVTSRLQLCNGVLKILHNKGQPNHSQCWMVLTHELELEWSCWQVEPVWLADNGMLTVGKCTCLSILDDVLWKMQICRNRRTHEPKQTLPHCNVNKQSHVV